MSEQIKNGWIAMASLTIDASPADIWDALTDPGQIKQYMFGTTVISDWEEGSKIVWKGEWEGKPYEDRGKVLKVEEGQLLQYSHFSPLSGQPDIPENYHTVTITLSGEGEETEVSLSQDGNQTEEEREHSAKNWRMMLESLQKLLED